MASSILVTGRHCQGEGQYPIAEQQIDRLEIVMVTVDVHWYGRPVWVLIKIQVDTTNKS